MKIVDIFVTALLSLVLSFFAALSSEEISGKFCKGLGGHFRLFGGDDGLSFFNDALGTSNSGGIFISELLFHC